MKKIDIDIEKINFQKLNGLIPVVVQHAENLQVLMLGFMNKDAFQETLKTGKVTFYSRRRKRLWTKGEESGNFLYVLDICLDCDNDTLLILALPAGPTCHTGEYSCFGEQAETVGILAELAGVIRERKVSGGTGSYTKKLFSEGLDRIIQKVGEEAIEVVVAAKNNDSKEFANEVADLLYHTLVLCEAKNVSLRNIISVLMKRRK